ncbi:hypothetical protein K438DRAFT_2090707 [Mycena galopus ATCC 62051]|nr:hypothetical protein K438DRAFT_2090707 [Mycena galopus ATCC 62051]
MKRDVKSELSRPSVYAYAPSHASDVHPASDGQGRGKARSIQRERMGVEKVKPPEARMHVSGKGETAKVPLLRPLAAGSEVRRDRHMKKCNTRSMLHQTRRARVQTPDRTPAQRAEHVKESWATSAHLNASAGTRRTTSVSAPPTWGNAALRKAWKREPRKFRIPAIEKNKERKDRERSSLTHETTAFFHRSVWPWRAWAAELPRKDWCPRSATLGIRARLRAWRRDAREVVWRLVRVAVAGGDDGGSGGAGPCEETRPKRRGKEQGGVGMGGRKSGAWHVNEKEQGEVSNGEKARWACAEEQGERRGRTDDEGQDNDGKLEAGGAGRRWQKERRVKSHARRIRWRNEGGVDHGLAKCGGRCERAKEEVELLEMEKRAACWEAQRVARADRAHPFSQGYARSLSIKGVPPCAASTHQSPPPLRAAPNHRPLSLGFGRRSRTKSTRASESCIMKLMCAWEKSETDARRAACAPPP